MAFISLGEALDRVLEKLAVEREERAGGIKAARELARGGRAERGHAAPAVTGVIATKNETPANGRRTHVITTGPEQPAIGKLKLRQGERRSEVRRVRS